MGYSLLRSGTVHHVPCDDGPEGVELGAELDAVAAPELLAGPTHIDGATLRRPTPLARREPGDQSVALGRRERDARELPEIPWHSVPHHAPRATRSRSDAP